MSPKTKHSKNRSLSSGLHSQTSGNSYLKRIQKAPVALVVSGFIQILAGLSIVTLAILGFIIPLWLASLMSVIGSVTTMTGAYVLYEILSEKNEIDSLYKEAIKRVIKSRN